MAERRTRLTSPEQVSDPRQRGDATSTRRAAHRSRPQPAKQPRTAFVPNSRLRRTAVRLKVGFILAAVVTSAFAVRLLQLQAIDPNAYASLAKSEGGRDLDLPATRGAILDRNNKPLATSIDGRMVSANPRVTTNDAPRIATLVSRILGIDYFEALTKLREPNSQFEALARRVPTPTARRLAEQLASADLNGIDLQPDPIRAYPANDVAANLLGFLGTDAQPLAGLERAYGNQLAGTDGEASYEVGADGQRLPLGESSITEPRDGTDLKLTIDRDVQWYTQRILQDTTLRAGGVTAAATVLDVRTGEVLALADYPTFDANKVTVAKPDTLGTRSLSDVYEPGSVQKVLTAAALIDAGRVTPATRIVVPGRLPRQDRVIGDYWDHGPLKLTLAGVLAKSSNIGTVLAADQITPRRLHNYLTKFGLGQRTGVGLGGEARGILAPPVDWSPINKATISFGQGVSVNVLQMAAAINTIANSGTYLPPTLVTDGGSAARQRSQQPHRVISKRSARLTSQMMEAVVDPDGGTAPLAGIPGYRVAGKTGTAQRANQACGCYDGTVTVSFAGFAPADDPRFAVYVVVHNPRNGGGGGTVAAPAFRQIMNYLLQKFAVPPTGTKRTPEPLTW